MILPVVGTALLVGVVTGTLGLSGLAGLAAGLMWAWVLRSWMATD